MHKSLNMKPNFVKFPSVHSCKKVSDSKNVTFFLICSFDTYFTKNNYFLDPRVRQAAFEALLNIHRNGHKLDSGTYQDLCKALTDDYEGVRMVGLALVQVMAISYPEEKVRDESGTIQRLIDDAFGKICNAVQDLSVQVREISVKLIGSLDKVSPSFLEQTLDKKLMSNMRSKKSAHERQNQIVASGEWSSGKKWADDAPK